MNKYYKSNRNNEEVEETTQRTPLGFSVKQSTSHCFRVHINTEFYGAEHYSQIFDLLLEAGEEDVVQFYIESCGGDMAGLNTLLEGIKLTDAHVVAVIVGHAHSAASLLALNCHDIVVCDGAEMLCHSVRLGSAGKIVDCTDYLTHSRKVSNKLMTETYEGFLTGEEIEAVLNGKELWLDADQIRERLNQRTEYITSEEDSDAEVKRDTDL